MAIDFFRFIRSITGSERKSDKVLMIDVDNFRGVNGRYGHQQGDLILVEIAKLLKSTFRGSDSVIRYGGDEFLVILPDTDERQAQLVIRRLVNAVATWNADSSVPGYRMSLSCGAASYQQGMDLQQVIDLACPSGNSCHATSITAN